MMVSIGEIAGLAVLTAVLSSTLALGVLKVFGKAMIENAVKHEFDKSLEDYRNQIRVRDRAEKIAKYLSYASQIDDGCDSEYFRRTNQLAWELFLWLPADVYKAVVSSLKPGGNFTEPLMRAREYLLEESPSTVSAEYMVRHGPSEMMKALRGTP